MSLAFAARHPDLLRSLCVHEPPLMGLCADDPDVREATHQVDDRVLPLIERGEATAAAQVFVNDVALGPGAWDFLPPEDQALMANNVESFLEEMRDPDWSTVDLAALAACPAPILLTYGDQSPPFLEKVVDVLRTSIPQVRVTEIEGAGHLPHITNVPDWLAVVREFVDKS